MKQAIPGVAPAESEEVMVMAVWPSIARYPSARWLGGLYNIKAGFYIFTLGNLFALASIPCAVWLYAYRLLRGFHYKLTNRRVIEMRHGRESKSIALDGFDSIDVERRPGQEWYDAGDLVFKLGDVETFRLEGVSRPEPFRQTCLKSRMSYVSVKQVLDREAVHA